MVRYVLHIQDVVSVAKSVTLPVVMKDARIGGNAHYVGSVQRGKPSARMKPAPAPNVPGDTDARAHE